AGAEQPGGPKEELPQDVLDLRSRVDRLPRGLREQLLPVCERVCHFIRLQGRLIRIAQEAVDQLHLDVRYLLCDLEATQRESGSACEYGNCYLLAERRFPTLFVGACHSSLAALMAKFNGPHVSYKLVRVTAENVNDVVPRDAGLLSIDIDGNDYWVWKALEA